MAQESASESVSVRVPASDRVLLEAIADYHEVSLSFLARDILTDFAHAFIEEEGWDKIRAKNAERERERQKAAEIAARQRQERQDRAAALAGARAGGEQPEPLVVAGAVGNTGRSRNKR